MMRGLFHVDSNLYPDADGCHHPQSDACYVSQAHWRTRTWESSLDEPAAASVTHSLLLTAPEVMHWDLLEHRTPVRATTALVPWSDAGIGLLVVATSRDAVLAVMDISGRPELAELERADRLGCVHAGVVSAVAPNEMPLIPMEGFADAVCQARSLRKLTAKELVAATTEVRGILRGPAAHRMLGVPGTRLRSITFSVVQPL